MTIPPYARLAQRLLTKGATDAPPPSAAAREDAIAALERAMTRKRAQRRWMRAGVVIAAAAVVVLASAVALRTSTRTGGEARAAVIAQPLGHGARIIGVGALEAGGRALAQGARLVALPEGDALLHFASGSVVTLEAESELTLVEAASSQTLALTHGALRAQVAKVAPGHHFVVTTPDAEISVVGTAFRLATVPTRSDCNAWTRTRLDVYEGVVSVRAGTVDVRVRAGEHWPADCVTAPTTNSPTDAGRPERLAPPPSAAARPEPRKAPDSTLSIQNDLFARALAAQRAGDLENGVRELDQLLTRYPSTPLAQDAAVERMKWLTALDDVRAVEAARTYLARYPKGYARQHAQAILDAHP